MYTYCDLENTLKKDGKLISKNYKFSLDDFEPLFSIVESKIPSGETVATILNSLQTQNTSKIDYGSFMILVYEEGTNYLDRLIRSESIRSQKFIDDLIGLTAKLESATKDDLASINSKISAIKYMLSVSGSERFDKVKSKSDSDSLVNTEFRMMYLGDEDIQEMDKAGLGGSQKILDYFKNDWKSDFNSPFRDELINNDKESLKESFDKSS